MDSTGTSHHILTDTSGGIFISSLSPALGGPATQSGVWNITSLINPLPSGTNVIGGVTGTFWPYTLGQQVAGSSIPVILPSATITTLTPPAAITNFANESGGHLANIDTNTALAATAAKQPGFGSAGSPSTNVSSVQGVSGGTPLSMSAASGTLTDLSGTITTGGTSQQIQASTIGRHYWICQNKNTTGNIYLNFTSAASASDNVSWIIYPGQVVTSDVGFVSTEAINITGDNTAAKFMFKVN